MAVPQGVWGKRKLKEQKFFFKFEEFNLLCTGLSTILRYNNVLFLEFDSKNSVRFMKTKTQVYLTQSFEFSKPQKSCLY